MEKKITATSYRIMTTLEFLSGIEDLTQLCCAWFPAGILLAREFLGHSRTELQYENKTWIFIIFMKYM